MQAPFSEKQYQFLDNCTATWNIAHGSVRTGKTIITLYAFMVAVDQCPDSNIWMIGYTSSTIYDNAIKLLFENPLLSVFRPFCSWNKQTRVLTYKDKVINTCGAENTGSAGRIQGQTVSLLYCDEMTLFAESMIYMLDTRLSNAHSKAFAAMNPSHPNHIIKKWIDKGVEGDSRYYSLHFVLEDNPYVSDDYKARIKESLSGIFYKRNYLGLWTLAEGAIYEFFDEDIHTVDRPPRAAEYWVAGIDYGVSNAFCCLLVGVNTGRGTGMGRKMWVEKEYFWDSHKKGRQKLNSEYADDVQAFLEPYGVRSIYIDPSASAFKAELRRRGMHTVDADNDVTNGIIYTTNEMHQGNVVICRECKNLIREIQGYVWDPKQSERGYDAPLKKDDHACVTGDTLVMTSNGEIRIDQLTNGRLASYHDQHGFQVDHYVNARKTRSNAEIYELELEDGRKLKATGDHKIMTARGYVELQQLMPCDIVLTWNINYTLEENST